MLYLALALNCRSTEPEPCEESSLQLRAVGSAQLCILTPTMLELSLVTTQKPDTVKVEEWDFVNERGDCRLPAPQEFLVSAGG